MIACTISSMTFGAYGGAGGGGDGGDGGGDGARGNGDKVDEKMRRKRPKAAPIPMTMPTGVQPMFSPKSGALTVNRSKTPAPLSQVDAGGIALGEGGDARALSIARRIGSGRTSPVAAFFAAIFFARSLALAFLAAS